MKIKNIEKNEKFDDVIVATEDNQLFQWFIILLTSIEVFALSLIVLRVNLANIDIPLMITGFFLVFCLVGVLICNKNE